MTKPTYDVYCPANDCHLGFPSKERALKARDAMNALAYPYCSCPDHVVRERTWEHGEWHYRQVSS